MPGGMLERQLSEVWRNQWLYGQDLVADNGEPITVVYPGRPNDDDRGPDYRDATVVVGPRRLAGDIELHVSSEDWIAHGHHLDPAYGRVILHVVMQHNPDVPTRRCDGQEVRVLALSGRVHAPACVWWPETDNLRAGATSPCLRLGKRLSQEDAADLLDDAGQARFLIKAAAFREKLAWGEAGQVLFEGVMTALGYSRNTTPFLELSRRLPLRVLESLVSHLRDLPKEESCAHIDGLLLSVAGLSLPHAGAGSMPGSPELESLWTAGFPVEVMPIDAWQLFRVRPQNSPAPRLASVSRLLVTHRDSGFLHGVLDSIKIADPENPMLLENPFLDAGIGRDRAGEIVINIVLPFARAFGELSANRQLSYRASAFYRRYRRLPLNCVEKHMIAQLGLNPRLVPSARQQQGLLHVYRTLCGRGKCSVCPLGQLEARNHVEVEPLALAV